jgi:dTDP-3-amino-2,3,6-trideoxy-4-keto-D-glucose/dTDP-3-amino-3,4,6-trideoxy-alpha-D-glucose/dTDP-2,6-dideoxy-D-kanosamine transaminase
VTIKVWDYLAEFEEEKDEVLAGIEKVLRSGNLILGESVRSFEAAFAEYCQVRFGVGVDNGTNGLFLALKALGVGAGDEVITVSNTAVPTVSAIVATGAVPVFVDIDADTYLMNVDDLAAAVTPRTKAIMPVHLFGQCVDMNAVNSVANARGLKVVEDCSQSHGAEFEGRKAGSMSDLSVFSFYPTKPLGGFGDGGMILTSDANLAARLRRLRFYGMDRQYYAEENGYNSRLDELHAEILFRKLKRLDLNNDRRRSLAERYNRLLAEVALKLPTQAAKNRHVYYLYVVAHPDRDRIMQELAARDIRLNISYPWPIHLMRGYRDLGYTEGDLPITEAAAKTIFSLPMYPKLSEADQNTVCSSLQQILSADRDWERSLQADDIGAGLEPYRRSTRETRS